MLQSCCESEEVMEMPVTIEERKGGALGRFEAVGRRLTRGLDAWNAEVEN